jgi:hypothetical protein
MEGLLKLCGGAMVCVVAIVVVRQIHRDSALPLQWIGAALVLGASLASELGSTKEKKA